ncbi:MAG: transposase [Algicola sp.]|nr:transposase [Algicola sp.]
MNKRKTYTKEFKLDAINLVLEQGYTIADAARQLEIPAPMLSRWINESKQRGEQAFVGSGRIASDQEEIKILKAQVQQLKIERDTFKNATVLLAKET